MGGLEKELDPRKRGEEIPQRYRSEKRAREQKGEYHAVLGVSVLGALTLLKEA